MSWGELFSRGEVREMIVTRWSVVYVHNGTVCDYLMTVVTDDEQFDIACESARDIAELIREFAPDSIRAVGGAEADALVASLEREREGATTH